jgi:DNA-binding Lrp family transcriptional regulator
LPSAPIPHKLAYNCAQVGPTRLQTYKPALIPPGSIICQVVRMAQEIQTLSGRERMGGARTERMSPFLSSKQEGDRSRDAADEAAVYSLRSSRAILSALADEPSRRILASGIARGKTVEEISAEQNLPLSTCYRRTKVLLAEGLIILERSVVTPAGKRYAVYRTSFSEATISFNNGEIAVEVTPNMDILDKLRRRWLSENYPTLNQDERQSGGATASSSLIGQSSCPFG